MFTCLVHSKFSDLLEYYPDSWVRFICFLGKITARQFCFEIYWPSLGPIGHPKCQLNIALIRAYYLISRALILICHFLIFLQLWRETLQFGLYRAPCAKVLLGPIGRPKRCPGAGRPRPIWLPEIQWYRKFLLNRKLQQPLPLRFCPCPYIQTLWRIYPDFI